MVGEPAPNPQSAVDKRTGHRTPPSRAIWGHSRACAAARAERQELGATAKETTATPSSLKISISSNTPRKCGDLSVSIGPTHPRYTPFVQIPENIQHLYLASTASHGPAAGLATPPSPPRNNAWPLPPLEAMPNDAFSPPSEEPKKAKAISSGFDSETFDADATIHVDGLVGSATISTSGRDVALAS